MSNNLSHHTILGCFINYSYNIAEKHKTIVCTVDDKDFPSKSDIQNGPLLPRKHILQR